MLERRFTQCSHESKQVTTTASEPINSNVAIVEQFQISKRVLYLIIPEWHVHITITPLTPLNDLINASHTSKVGKDSPVDLLRFWTSLILQPIILTRFFLSGYTSLFHFVEVFTLGISLSFFDFIKLLKCFVFPLMSFFLAIFGIFYISSEIFIIFLPSFLKMKI